MFQQGFQHPVESSGAPVFISFSASIRGNFRRQSAEIFVVGTGRIVNICRKNPDSIFAQSVENFRVSGIGQSVRANNRRIASETALTGRAARSRPAFFLPAVEKSVDDVENPVALTNDSAPAPVE